MFTTNGWYDIFRNFPQDIIMSHGNNHDRKLLSFYLFCSMQINMLSDGKYREILSFLASFSLRTM